jgi:hypothetical protein
LHEVVFLRIPDYLTMLVGAPTDYFATLPSRTGVASLVQEFRVVEAADPNRTDAILEFSAT